MSISSTPAKSESVAMAIDPKMIIKTPKQSIDETLSALEQENEKLLDELKLRETNKSHKQQIKQSDVKAKKKSDDESSKFDLELLRKNKDIKT